MIVIDSNDEEGLKYVKTDVDKLLQERDLKDIPCIVVFNKSDLACMSSTCVINMNIAYNLFNTLNNGS